MIYVWKTLNYKIYEMTPSYNQYSKKIKACGLTRETIMEVKWKLNIPKYSLNL